MRRGNLRQRDIGQAESRAVSRDAALRQPQRLHGRLRQIVDQDRRGRPFAQLLQQLPRLRDIGGMRVLAGRGRVGDQVPRAQGADENRVVLVFGGEAHVVGKCRRDAQVDAAPRRFPAQEIGLHLDVAIAEQQRHRRAFRRSPRSAEPIRAPRRPVRMPRLPSPRAGSAPAFRRDRARAWRKVPRRRRPALPRAFFR